YQKGDLAGVFLVIVAEYQDDEDQRIYEEAEERGILVNVMDDIPHCNFTFGSLLKRGPLTISISTSGAAPAMAVRLRARFEKEVGKEYEEFLQFSRSLRKPMARAYPSFQERKQLWYKLVDSDILALIRSNEHELAYKKAAGIVGHEVVREALDS
ncbi:MAG TPA: bifunctional precorrin-2 dehydrogenase/sirohydrochlorin ferrochelatase, partial [Balneolales bacterium]|nr:bifunctional precorrin-2 dehydrogenase/sirohydrochlorin ferrochelatase [Balneolales bacterium]